MRELWFNQNGEEDLVRSATNEEDTPDFGLGDTIDKFDDNPRMNYSHDFGPDAIPEELQWNEQGEHCEFIYTENHNIQSDMNFAKTQEEIDELYDRQDKLYELWDEEGCF